MTNTVEATQDSHNTHGVWTEQLATWYVEQWGEHPMHDCVAHLAGIDRKQKVTVLDIGCGSGSVVRKIAEFIEHGEVIGIDPTAKMIEYAKAQDSTKVTVSMHFEQAGAEHIPCPDNHADIIVAVNSLHHWQDVTKGLSEVRRVLKPTGKLLLIDELWDEMPEFEKPPGNAHEHHEHLNKYKDTEVVKACLDTAGLKNISKKVHRSEGVAVSAITAFNS